MDTSILQEIGFSPGEIKVYFALLELGQTTIGPLAKQSKVTPAKVYGIIDRLMSKGLATSIIQSGTKHFEAVSPKKILEYLDEKGHKIEEEKTEIKKLIPQIEAIKQFTNNLVQAEIYQSFQGLRTLYQEAIEVLKANKEDFIGFTLGKEEYRHKESEHFFREFDTKRRNMGIKVKLIGHISQKSFLNNITKHDKNITIRYLPYQMPTGVIIFGDRIATIVWHDIPTAFVMQSNQVADSYKKFFWDMWRIAQ